MTMTASKTHSDAITLLDGLPPDGLHSALQHAEQQIAQLDSSNIEQFLVQMDEIEQMLTRHIHHDSKLPDSPYKEEERWHGLLKFVTTNPHLVTRAAAQAGGLNKLGSQYPPATGLWWHANWLAANQINRRWRWSAFFVAAATIVALTFWIISRITARDAMPGEVGSSPRTRRRMEQQN